MYPWGNVLFIILMTTAILALLHRQFINDSSSYRLVIYLLLSRSKHYVWLAYITQVWTKTSHAELSFLAVSLNIIYLHSYQGSDEAESEKIF